jgi:hypothetical protein
MSNLLFYDNGQKSMNVLGQIQQEGMQGEFKYFDVTNPAVADKLPVKYKSDLPVMSVKGMNRELRYDRIMAWIPAQKYLNIYSNNIETARNPELHVTQFNGVRPTGNFAALQDGQDKLYKKTFAVDKIGNNIITESVGKRYIDKKMSEAAQREQMQKAIQDRKHELDKILGII